MVKRKAIFAIVVAGLLMLVTLALVQALVLTPSSVGLAHRFLVEIDDMEDLRVREVFGLHCGTGIAEEFEDNNSRLPDLLPGITRCGPIVLRRNLTTDSQLADWYADVVDGDFDRRNGLISVLNEEGAVVASYAFFEAWPAAYGTDPLLAYNEIPAIEEVVLAVEWIERVD